MISERYDRKYTIGNSLNSAITSRMKPACFPNWIEVHE